MRAHSFVSELAYSASLHLFEICLKFIRKWYVVFSSNLKEPWCSKTHTQTTSSNRMILSYPSPSLISVPGWIVARELASDSFFTPSHIILPNELPILKSDINRQPMNR